MTEPDVCTCGHPYRSHLMRIACSCMLCDCSTYTTGVDR